jgi:hypothetical protein
MRGVTLNLRNIILVTLMVTHANSCIHIHAERERSCIDVSYTNFDKMDGQQNKTQHIIAKGKGKAIPVQAWTGPEGSRRLRFPDFKTVGT